MHHWACTTAKIKTCGKVYSLIIFEQFLKLPEVLQMKKNKSSIEIISFSFILLFQLIYESSTRGYLLWESAMQLKNAIKSVIFICFV